MVVVVVVVGWHDGPVLLIKCHREGGGFEFLGFTYGMIACLIWLLFLTFEGLWGLSMCGHNYIYTLYGCDQV